MPTVPNHPPSIPPEVYTAGREAGKSITGRSIDDRLLRVVESTWSHAWHRFVDVFNPVTVEQKPPGDESLDLITITVTVAMPSGAKLTNRQTLSGEEYRMAMFADDLIAEHIRNAGDRICDNLPDRG